MKKIITLTTLTYFLVSVSTFVWAQSKQIQSTRANYLHGTNRDGVPYSGVITKYTGRGMYLNVVENPISVSHPEFNGRVENYALGGSDSHATEVASVAASSGIRPQTKGIAFESTIRSYGGDDGYNRNPFLLEPMLLQGNENRVHRHLVTNHSYLFRTQFAQALTYGTYELSSSLMDSLTYKYPYWLPVIASGNEGEMPNNGPNTTITPNGYNYDRLPGGYQTAKNTLVVGGIASFLLTADGLLAQATLSRSASFGPTDDLRVKPEVVAPNEDLAVASLNQDYGTNTGTSFSAPAVSGVALLLQQRYKAKNGRYMRAATLKALLLHTAERITPPAGYVRNDAYGPDPFGGYGLINARFAAKTIEKTWLGVQIEPESIIHESTLTAQVLSKSYPLPTKAGQPVMASICWTDPQHRPELKLNFENPMLINDLELRVVETASNGVVSALYPYSFYRSSDGNVKSLNTQPNSRDTYELVRFVPRPYCSYYAYIYCRGSLKYDRQQFSLVVTGLGKDQDLSNCDTKATVKQKFSTNVPISATKQVILAQGGLLSDRGLLSVHACDLAVSQLATREAAFQDMTSVESENTIQIFPNPTATSCKVYCPEGIRQLSIYTQDGQLIRTYTGNDVNEKEIELSSFAVGMYFIHIESKMGRISINKLIKQP